MESLANYHAVGVLQIAISCRLKPRLGYTIKYNKAPLRGSKL